jgi:lipopolysaccharide/colanic/teichoic acid biosynthesis glycosyltransferase
MSDVDFHSQVQPQPQRGFAGALVPWPDAAELRGKVLVVLAFALADVLAGAAAAALTSYLITGHVSFSFVSLAMLVVCGLAFGVYTDETLPHVRLRRRAQAVGLYSFILFMTAEPNTPEYGYLYQILQALLLFVLSSYAELGVQKFLHGKLADPSDLRLQNVEPAQPAAFDAPLKRAIDLIIAVPAAILLAPVIGLMILKVKLTDPGPAIYVQTRVGRDGHEIRLFKIRTMYLDSAARLNKYLDETPEARAEWATYYKLYNDPRILPQVGHFLRRSSIDELPQLWNVIRGDMTIVGPRPLPDYHANSFDAEFQKVRTSVTPGLTGLCQVAGRRSELDIQRAHDLFYLRNRSFWLDLYIIMMTVPAVLTGSDAR